MATVFFPGSHLCPLLPILSIFTIAPATINSHLFSTCLLFHTSVPYLKIFAKSVIFFSEMFICAGVLFLFLVLCCKPALLCSCWSRQMVPLFSPFKVSVYCSLSAEPKPVSEVSTLLLPRPVFTMVLLGTICLQDGPELGWRWR